MQNECTKNLHPKNRQWEQDGVKRYATEVHVNEMAMLSNKKEAANSNTPQASQSSSATPAPSSVAPEENDDLPSKSSLDQKMSDVVGEINYNFSKIGNIDYKFLLDHNFNDLNYQEVSTELNFGKVQFNLDYLEENKHVGTEHYASSGISLNFNDQNKLSFSTKKNFKTDSTELYDLNYQYSIDCLTAGLVYRREFYQDSDLEPKNSLMFTITFVPFSSINSLPLSQ